MNIALIGLGSMGYNLAKNMVSKNYQVNAYEKNKLIVESINNDNIKNLCLLNSTKELIDKTPSPRIILLSLPANKIDECISDLINYLNPKDIIADLGNSLYLHSIEREKLLKDHNISFLGIGISGGPRGAKDGPAIMVGGSKSAWENVRCIFEDISAKIDNKSACCYFGSAGSGHFVKLIHNGIEYALMQGLAEISNILEHAYNMDNDLRAKKFEEILKTQSSSFLLKITSEIISAQNNILTAIKADQLDVFEYIPKPLDLNDLTISVDRSLKKKDKFAEQFKIVIKKDNFVLKLFILNFFVI